MWFHNFCATSFILFQQRKATFTLMDLKRELKCWFQLIDRLATFHKNFVDDQVSSRSF